MTEAGQIFALLRASSAAELAKRFNAVEPMGPVSGGPAADGTESLPVPHPQGGGATRPQAGQGALATGPAGQAGSLPDPEGGGPVSELEKVLPGLASGPIRAAVALGHLAPARLDAARIMAEGLLAGQAPAADGGEAGGMRLPGPVPTGPGAAAGAAMAAALAGLRGAAEGSQAQGLGGQAPGLDAESAGHSPTPGAPPAAGAAGRAGGADPRTTASLPPVPGLSTVPSLADPGLTGAEAAALAAVREGQDARLALATRAAATPVQLAAFAETLASLLDPAGAARSSSVASGVIFNAAMIPGWPFPTAFARDGGEAINPKAMLHRLAAAIEGMTPEQAAEYMAKIGGGHVFLRNLRKLLKELDRVDQEDVKGLLFAFLETISTIASGIQMAFRQLSESAALQAAVVHGEDPDEGDRPGRRRLRL